MNDFISRQAAIDAMKCINDSICEQQAADALDGLPSADVVNREVVSQIQWERDTAISQLKDLGYGLGEKIRTDGDTISRQAAINVVKGIDSYFVRFIEELPSAEPEIIRCKECKYYDGSPCEIVDWYNTADDFCSYAERRTDD